MPNNIFNDSVSVIESWIREDGRNILQSSNIGKKNNYIYKYLKKNNGRLFEFELSIKSDKVLLSTRDFYIIEDAFVPTIARYCQEMDSKSCYSCVDAISKDIMFGSEVFFIEQPISKQTMDLLEKELIGLFFKHEENLNNLTKGHFLSIKPVENCFICNNFQKEYDVNIWKNDLREILKDSDKDFYELSDNQKEEIILQVSRIVPNAENEYRFYYELMNNGLLQISYVATGRTNDLSESDKYLFSEYISTHNSKTNKVAVLALNKEGIGSSCMISMLDGPIGKGTIDLLEHNCIKTMLTEYSYFDVFNPGELDLTRPNTNLEDIVLMNTQMEEMSEEIDNHFMDLPSLDELVLDDILNEISSINEEDNEMSMDDFLELLKREEEEMNDR